MTTPDETPPTAPLDPTLKTPSAGAGGGSRPSSPSAPPEAADPHASQCFGKFVRVAKLGAGGMGEVWKAWDRELGRWVALKFLKGGDDEEIARFMREAQTAGRLTHPHIASVFEVGFAQERHFIAMQFVDGQTLKTFPRDDRRRLVRLLRDAALAVQYAHDQGIVHRDLKPENLMVTVRGTGGTRRFDKGAPVEDCHVYVMDFGLARAVEGEKSISVSGSVVGTPAYMPPEQARGQKVDGRADVYSLGATLYELVTDRPPFKGASVYEVMAKVEREEPKRPRTIDARIDVDLETVVLKCLEKDPARRYATAGALAEDLDRWIAGEPIAARPISGVERLVRRIRRNKLLWATGAALGVAVVAGGGGLALQRREASIVLAKKDEDRRASEGRLNRLSTLWMEVILRKQELRALRVPAAQAQDALAGAVGALGTFIRENPGLPQGYYLRARGRLYLEDREGALQDADKTLELAPGFSLALRLRGMIRTEMAIDLITGPPETYLERERERKELSEKAAKDFKEAGAWREEDLRLWGLAPTGEDESMRVVAEAMRREFALGDHAGAMAYLEAALRGRRQEEYAALLGSLGGDMKRFDEAVEWAPGYAWALFGRGTLKSKKGDKAGAVADFDRAIAIQKDSWQAYLNRGNAKRMQGDLAGAIADYDRAIGLRKDFALGYCNRGAAKQAAGDLSGAIADLDRAIEIRGDYAEAYFIRGYAKQSGGDPAGAIADYDRAVELKKDYSMAYNNRGNARRAKGDMAGAMADYDRAIELEKDNVEAYVNRGGARRERGDAAGAIADLDRAIDLKKDCGVAYNHRGLAKQDRGDLAGAIADFDRAIEIRKDDAEAYRNRGLARISRDLDGAIADYDRAIELNKDFWNAYDNRGWARKLKGDLAGALSDFDRVIGLKPNFAGAYLGRGNVKQIQGDRVGAIADFEKALEVAPPKWSYRPKVEAMLKALRN
jgi:tetratricopeptide (TPR) repeat protein